MSLLEMSPNDDQEKSWQQFVVPQIGVNVYEYIFILGLKRVSWDLGRNSFVSKMFSSGHILQ